MLCLLDTDTCIDIIRKRCGPALDRLLTLAPGDVGVSSITAGELAYGVQRSRDRERNTLALEQFLLPLLVARFDEVAAMVYGQVRAALEASSLPMGGLDTLIGAHALALGVVLVTNNVREFSHIAGLRVEHWLM